MLKEELYYELTLSYYDLVKYLIKKYGPAQYDYFCNSNLKSKNPKVPRTSEGLYCHHIFEDRGLQLSTPSTARRQPLEWQNKENLVYCNLLEHLILHIKIEILRQKTRLMTPMEIEHFFVGGGVFFICSDINDLFKSKENLPAWKIRCFEEIKDNYEDYLLILNALLCYINWQYAGKRSNEYFLQEGSIVKFHDADGKILKLSPMKDRMLLRFNDGSEKEFFSFLASNQFTDKDYFDLVVKKFCRGRTKSYSEVYKDILTFDDERIESVAQALGVDFRGYGFPRFTEYKLDKRVCGSENLDEYISKGLPSYSNPHYATKLGIPHFWVGNIPRKVFNGDYYFVVRIRASFNIKAGKEAFVRCVYKAPFFKTTNDNNFLFKKGVIMKNSNDFDKPSGNPCEFRNNRGDKTRCTEVELTLGRDDFELFHERYNITSLTVLDGFWFS